MGTLWRSAPMELLQLIVQRDACFEACEELGRMGLTQFKDLNPQLNAFAREFAEDIKGIEELERKVRYFEKAMRLAGLKAQLNMPPGNDSLEELERLFDRIDRDLRRESMTEEMLQREMNQMREEMHVLNQDPSFYHAPAGIAGGRDAVPRVGGYSDDPRRDRSGGAAQLEEESRVGFLVGVVAESNFEQFQRLLYRATRGKLYLSDREIVEPIVDPATGDRVKKRVFMTVAAGELSRSKAKKICESFGANVYPYPENAADAQERLNALRAEMDNKQTVLDITTERKMRILNDIRPQVRNWRKQLARNKAIYHTLNMWKYVSGSPRVTAELWCPKSAIGAVKAALVTAEKRAAAGVSSITRPLVPAKNDVIPTYFPLNKVTSGFQNIVDSYGVPRYGEVNPGVFTISTFPFLFAVMFGDWGHALCMLCFALYLVLAEKKLGKSNLDEIFGMLFKGRYVLLFMSIFSIYTGLIYNDLFSLAFDMFGSPYPHDDTQFANFHPPHAYPFGVDPVWFGRDNKLNYYNSLKMKMSVILGVTHMLFGVVMSLLNNLYNKNYLNVFTMFIPEFIFLSFTFGYMCVMIFVKWCIDWSKSRPAGLAQGPPSLLTMMTSFFLQLGGVNEGDLIYESQPKVQAALLVIAVLAIPVLLLPKPLILRYRHKQELKRRGLAPADGVPHTYHESRPMLLTSDSSHEDEENEGPSAPLRVEASDHSAAAGSSGGGGGHDGHGDGEFEFSDVMMHQMIHTIEYVLGAISNTASYLRLWALSLAHAQLSEVFWDFVLAKAIAADNYYGIFTFVGFAIWSGVTVGVLLMMESLSAFLHALRLHWVEFQSKFYVGDGVKFIPFSLLDIDKRTEEEIVYAETHGEDAK